MAADLGIARDDRNELRAAFDRGLAADVFVLSGGVSVGEMDLTPSILREAGVTEVFHKIKLKPGKPLWFGVRDVAGRRTLEFWLPGNPVSSFVSFQWFVRAALDRLGGGEGSALTRTPVILDGEFKQLGDRETFRPAQLVAAGDELRARLLAWEGSGDLARLALADCLVRFPAGEQKFTSGDRVDAYRL